MLGSLPPCLANIRALCTFSNSSLWHCNERNFPVLHSNEAEAGSVRYLLWRKERSYRVFFLFSRMHHLMASGQSWAMMGIGTRILYHFVSSLSSASAEKIGVQGNIFLSKAVLQHCSLVCFWLKRKSTRSSAFISQAPWAVSALQADLVAHAVQMIWDGMQMLKACSLRGLYCLVLGWQLQNTRTFLDIFVKAGNFN